MVWREIFAAGDFFTILSHKAQCERPQKLFFANYYLTTYFYKIIDFYIIMCYNQNNHYLSLIGVTPVFPRESLMTRVFFAHQ
jgi:hypothetical protein